MASSSTQIRVLMDLDNVLGGISQNRNSRTGLYWSALQIVQELLPHPQLHLTFITNKYFGETYTQLCTTNKIFTDHQCLVAKHDYGWARFLQRQRKKFALGKKTKKGITWLSYRLIYLIFSLVELPVRAVDLFFPKKLPVNFDVYQSFFYPLPKFVLQHSHLKKCILIHDVIHISQCFEKKITNKKLFKFFQQLDSNIVFFYNSTYTRNDFLEIFPSYRANKNLVALLAADAKKFYPLTQLDPQIRSHTLKKYGIPTKDKYILSLCSLNPRKNLPFLVEGFAKFLELHPTVKDLNLVLAGPPGWQLEGLEKKINDYPTLRSKIIRTGYLEPSDINLIYNTALCFTYLSLYEGFGLPLLEAMCCGLPVIAAKTTSLPEVYGDAALSINPHNLSELVTALENIYFHPQQRHQLQQKSLARSQLFSWQKTAAVFSKEYLTNIRPSSQTE